MAEREHFGALVFTRDASLAKHVCSLLQDQQVSATHTDRPETALALQQSQTFPIVFLDAREKLEEVKALGRNIRVQPGTNVTLVLVFVASHYDATEFASVGVEEFIVHKEELPLRLHLATRRARGRINRTAIANDTNESKEYSLAAVLAEVPAFLLVLDEQGAITFINRGGAAGSAEQVVGTSAREHLPQDDRPKFDRAFACAKETLRPDVYETTTYGGAFQVRVAPIVRNGIFAGATLVATDITERKQIERELRASEQRLRAFVEAIPDMFFRISSDGVLLDVHAGTDGELSNPADELRGKSITEVLPPPVARLVLPAVDRVRETGSNAQVEYHWPISPDASDFEARIVRTESNELVAIVRNITERRRLEAQLRLTDRLSSVGTLAAGVAHEINNPLAYVLLNLGYLGRVLREPAALLSDAQLLANAQRSAAEGLEGVEQVRRIISDLRTISRDDASASPLTPLAPVLEACARIASGIAGTEARFVFELEPELWVRIAPGQLGQVFLNLFVNAAHATSGQPPERCAVNVRAHDRENALLLVEIEDHGNGIPNAHADRVFDPFFTTKPTGEGTGLGLWICRRILERAGGSIHFRSRENEGTTFFVRLPCVEAGESNEAARS